MTEPRRPTRATSAGRAYLDLQNLARRRRRPTDERHQLYALEGFLARLASSTHAHQLTLKGGALLAAYDVRRPTRDIDLAAQTVPADLEHMRDLITEIAAITIRDEDQYSGVRVSLTATLSNARLSLHVDVNVGDPIWPAPATVQVQRLLGGTITVARYPLPMVLAEQITTAVRRGAANTRWRDFADIYLLTRHHRIDGADLRRCLREVATYRQATLEPLSTVLDGYAGIGRQRWAVWRRRNQLGDLVPESFAELLAVVIAFADPVLTATVSPQRWDVDAARWL